MYTHPVAAAILSASNYPALSGDVVTEGHARICRERGHATHTVNGVESGRCPRCGEISN